MPFIIKIKTYAVVLGIPLQNYSYYSICSELVFNLGPIIMYISLKAGCVNKVMDKFQENLYSKIPNSKPIDIMNNITKV